MQLYSKVLNPFSHSFFGFWSKFSFKCRLKAGCNTFERNKSNECCIDHIHWKWPPFLTKIFSFRIISYHLDVFFLTIHVFKRTEWPHSPVVFGVITVSDYVLIFPLNIIMSRFLPYLLCPKSSVYNGYTAIYCEIFCKNANSTRLTD